jgi:phosphatidylglycerol:prolipoprotein diacylglycerol transferase
MWPQILRIPLPLHLPIIGDQIVIYSYGLMLVIGFLAATQLARFLARRSGLDGEVFINAALWALISGIVGARLSHILENLSQFTRADRSLAANIAEMFNLQSGGLTYYGGFLLAFPTLLWYARRKKVPIRLGMDIVAPCLMIGLGFGRIGCFLNGCCYGAEAQVACSVCFPYHSNAYVDQYYRGRLAKPPPAELLTLDRNGKPRLRTPDEIASDPALAALAANQHSNPLHPAQLYSAVTAFLLAALLLAHFTVRTNAGQVFALMMMLEGLARFLLEMLRAEPAVLGGVFSLSMLLSAALAATGAVLWRWFARTPAPVTAAAGASPPAHRKGG